MSDLEKDLASYRTYLELWQSENPIKTNKLQILLLTNALLLAVLALTPGFEINRALLSAGGAALNFIWLLSIARTSLFQKVWQYKLRDIAAKPEYTGDPRFQILDTGFAERLAPRWLRAVGGVSSKYYLTGAPFGFLLCWLAVLIYVVSA